MADAIKFEPIDSVQFEPIEPEAEEDVSGDFFKEAGKILFKPGYATGLLGKTIQEEWGKFQETRSKPLYVADEDGNIMINPEADALRRAVVGVANGDPEAIKDVVVESLFSLGPSQFAHMTKKFLESRKLARADQELVKSAHQVLDEFENIVVHEAAAGRRAEDALANAERLLGRTADELEELRLLTGRSLELPPSQDEALDIINRSFARNIETEEVAAVAELAKRSGLRGSVAESAADTLKIVSTRVKELSEDVFGMLRKYELDWRVALHRAKEEVKPFLEEFNGLTRGEQRVVKRALLHGDFDQVQRVWKTRGLPMTNFKRYQKVMDDMWSEMRKAGYRNAEKVHNYFPRVLKNPDKFLKALGHREKSLATKQLQASADRKGKSILDLTAEEKSEAISRALFGDRPKGAALGSSKSRNIREIPDEILDAYADPLQALESYLRRTVSDTKKRQFLGRFLKLDKGENIDYEKTLTGFLADHKIATSAPEFNELKSLLLSRFREGEISPGKMWQVTRNLTYTGTIANPFAAITQIQDVGISMKRFGLTNVLKSIVGKRHSKVVDMGITEAAQELAHSPSKTARVMEFALRVSMFEKMDHFGKNIILNSALRRNWNLAKTEKGRAVLEKKWGKVLGPNTAKTIDDLRAGKVTDDVRLLLWNELSDIQPVSLLEVPKAYLDNPRGRILYALKTFTIRQVDAVLNDTVRIMKTPGRRLEGVKNMTTYLVYLGAAGVGADTLKKAAAGQHIDPDEIPDAVFTNMLKIFGASEFITNKLKTGQAGTAIADMVEPAVFGLLNAVGNDLFEMWEDGETDASSLKYAPVIGKLWYEWMGPGLEKKAKETEKRLYGDMDSENERNKREQKLYSRVGL